jgi:hypothetical protein
MRRSASEIIRNLEKRIDRLEKKAHLPNRGRTDDTGEISRSRNIFEDHRRDDDAWLESVSRSEKSDEIIKSTLKRSRIKYKMYYDRFEFADKRTLVKALEALGVNSRQAIILGEVGTDLQKLNLFGKSYNVGVPDLEDEQYDYYLEASF